jgi:hypothetical protein|tara:strand:+ start:1962 stop:2270 length:309 start_codon:yes stop_codon:yes gene_type:complete
MSEKKGATAKLEYPFNSAGCLEVQLPNGNWYRITCREFRSYTYPRRISHLKNKEYITEVYKGPTYLYGTNIIMDLNETEKKGLLYPNDVDPRISKKGELGRL